MATVKQASVVDSAFYACLKFLNDGNYSGMTFSDAQSALGKVLKLSYAERIMAYFTVPGSPGYGLQVESRGGSLDGRDPALFELRYASKNPINKKALWTSSKLEDIFSEAQTRSLSLEQVAAALEDGGLAAETWGNHYKTFSIPLASVCTKDAELKMPGTVVVELRETPKYAHDRFCTEFMLEVHARLVPELAKPSPAKQSASGAYAGTLFNKGAAVKRNP